MKNNYKGYLLKFGDYQLPNSFINKYPSTPNQRLEKKAWRDNTEYLNRVTSTNFKSTLKPEIRRLSLDETALFESIKAHGLLNADQRKYQVTYWNRETLDYATGEFYVSDIEYNVDHIADEEAGELYYEAFTLEMIQY
jgi:hypothetical protein